MVDTTSVVIRVIIFIQELFHLLNRTSNLVKYYNSIISHRVTEISLYSRAITLLSTPPCRGIYLKHKKDQAFFVASVLLHNTSAGTGRGAARTPSSGSLGAANPQD